MKLLKSIIKNICVIGVIIFLCQISNASEGIQSTKLKVEDFFKNFTSLEANFIQVNPSGKISKGKIYLDLPGKLRIDYEDPKNLLITSQGFWIVIQDRDAKTTNNIPLKSSPFSILLQEDFILNNKNFKTNYTISSGIISLKIKSQENDKLEAIVLEFTEKPLDLKKWIILDTFGESTTVLIQNAKYNNNLSHLLFFPLEFPEPAN